MRDKILSKFTCTTIFDSFLGYKHYSVIHKDSFKAVYKDVENNIKEVHTNSLEGAWMKAKKRLKNMHGKIYHSRTSAIIFNNICLF